jgi:hypothetical protein
MNTIIIETYASYRIKFGVRDSIRMTAADHGLSTVDICETLGFNPCEIFTSPV